MSELEDEKLKALEEADENDFEEEDGGLDEIEVDTELFATQLLRFPASAEAPRNKEADQLFDLVFNAYEDENLTEEQDHIIEFLLHLQEEDSPFNLSRAMEVWNKEDRRTFLAILSELNESLNEG